jgi:hypothetical protein
VFDDSPVVLPAVKAILATVLLALAVYQVLLMLVGYGKVSLPVLSGRAASRTHRAVGDTVVAVAFVVAALCVGFYEVGDGVEDHGSRVLVHTVAAWALVAAIVVKVSVVRWGGRRFGRFLPLLGSCVFALFVVVWATSAAFVLGG